MITTCSGCETRYQLEDARVPPRVIRVRCPKCSAVFSLDGTLLGGPQSTPGFESFTASPAAEPMPQPPEPVTAADAESAAAVETAAPAAAVVDKEVAPGTARHDDPADVEPMAGLSGGAAGAPGSAPPASPAAETETGGETAVAVEDPPSPTRRRGRDKARMLARALVSDIMVYNQTARDKALADGNLLEALGPEIKKSWELYKDKVGAEVANDTTHFRDALNEILAGGKKIF